MDIEAYKFTPPNILAAPQILFDVIMFHVLENETQWVLGGGVHPYERYNVWVHETTACEYFVVEPLPIDFRYRGIL